MPEQSQQPFESVAVSAIVKLQGVVLESINALSARVRRPADLQKAMSLDSKLAWQVYKLAKDSTPAAAGALIPPRVSFERYIRAAKDRNVSSDITKRLGDVFDELERLIVEHAGDRERFESMVASMSKEDKRQADLKHKKAAFRANCHLRGVQSRVSIKTMIYAPTADPMRYDIVAVRGFVDVERSQERNSMTVTAMKSTSLYRPGVKIARETLDPKGELQHGLSMLTEFCSKPTPKVKTSNVDDLVLAQLVGLGLGKTSAATVFTGEVGRGYNPFEDPGEASLICSCITEEPAELLIFDVMFAGNLFRMDSPITQRPQTPRVLVCDSMRSLINASANNDLDSIELHVKEECSYLGTGAEFASLSEYPQYTELVRWACQRAGFDARELRIFRSRVEYPTMPSVLAMHFPLSVPGGKK